jgi:hypothetical protein
MTLTSAGCEGCRFLVRQDYGYSNYTTMGTQVYCLKGVNPHTPLDSDMEDPKLETALAYGETCSDRVAGDGAWLDVDGEALDDLAKSDPELHRLIVAGNT